MSSPTPPFSESDDPLERKRVGAAAFVLSLRARGVSNVAVLRALETVPREVFAPRRFADLARADVALPLACGQTMTAPATVAQMLVALDVRPGDRVREVGTGSGYVTALLARLGGQVRSFELRSVLRESAERRLAAAGFAETVELVCADGFAPERAPVPLGGYDRILLNGVVAGPPDSAGIEAVLETLDAVVDRLDPGGRLVCGVATDTLPRLLTITRDAEGTLTFSAGGTLRLSPLAMPKAVPLNGCLT